MKYILTAVLFCISHLSIAQHSGRDSVDKKIGSRIADYLARRCSMTGSEKQEFVSILIKYKQKLYKLPQDDEHNYSQRSELMLQFKREIICELGQGIYDAYETLLKVLRERAIKKGKTIST